MPIQSFQPPVSLSHLSASPTSFGAVGTPGRAGGDIATPTVANLQEDPGYQFRLNQGIEAIQRAQGARGMLGSGATLKGLSEFGQGLASQEYGNAFNRAMQQGGFAQQEQARRFSERLGQSQFAAGERGRVFGENLQNRAFTSSEQARAFGERLQARQLQEGLTQGQFGRGITLENLQESLRHGQFGRQMGLADIGLRALGFSPGAPQLPASQAQFGGLGAFSNLMSGAAGSMGQAGQFQGVAAGAPYQGIGSALTGLSGLAGQGMFGGFGGGGGLQASNLYSLGGTGFIG